VLISYPSYEAVSFSNSEKTIHEIDSALRTNKNVTVISKPEDYRFSIEYIYDDVHHLNAQGRRLRTQQLVEDLRATLR
jgi:hypothetical protein